MKNVLVALCVVLLSSGQFTEEDKVVVLTEANFEKALKVYEYLLVAFHAPFDEKR